MCEQQPLLAFAHHSNQRGEKQGNLRVYVLSKWMSFETPCECNDISRVHHCQRTYLAASFQSIKIKAWNKTKAWMVCNQLQNVINSYIF